VGAPPDIARLTDAWLRGEIGPLLPYCEVAQIIPPGGRGNTGKPVTTRLVIETAIWTQIMDEVESRGLSELREREDFKARAEGFTSAKNALDVLGGMPPNEAAPVYARIFSG
jgi:hypothetical protein